MSKEFSSPKTAPRNKKTLGIFIFLTFMCWVVTAGTLVYYTDQSEILVKIENLEYKQGEVDYFNSYWRRRYYRYSRFKRRFRNRNREYFDLHLNEELTRYTSGAHFFDNIYDEPFYKLLDYSHDQLVTIGYISTNDPYVKEIYALEIDGYELVDTKGIVDDLKSARVGSLIGCLVSAVGGLIFIFLFLRKRKTLK